MGRAIEDLAALVAETGWEEIPDGVRDHAKLVLLDTLGVILAGSEQPEVAGLRDRLSSGGTGATVYARGFPTLDPRQAALLNGTAGRSIELCEGHRYVSCQGAVQIVPAVLAAAEQVGADGRAALAGLILGYEAAVRIGAGTTPRPLAHQNGQWPLIGAVAGAARVRGLDAAQTSLAMRIAATQVLTPSYTNAVAGATALNLAGGMAGLAGALAPDLALAGFAAQPDAIEEAFGALVGDGFRPEPVIEELGQRWEIGRNYFRLRACCNPIYAALDALEEALAALQAAPGAIERIDVATYRFASVMRDPDPINYFAAKYSLPHAAAATIVRGDASYGSFTEEALRDPAIAAIRPKVHITEDPAFTAMVPRLKPARVTVTLTDGRSATRTCESPAGDFQRPYSEDQVREKFRGLATLVLTAEGVRAAEEYVDALDDEQSLRSLGILLRSHSR